MQNFAKEKVLTELQLQQIRYERQLESVKQIYKGMTNLIKSNFIEQEQYTKQCRTGKL